MSVPFQRALVTGAAGFIGSTLVDRLLELGVQVVGIDCFTSYYAASQKEANLRPAEEHSSFELRHVDLTSDKLEGHLDGVDVVFHQAAQPGVRASWAEGFSSSLANNVLATQRLLEASRVAGLARFVYASSSSVYGDATETPMREDGPLRPYSPYGVTKLAAEHLCTVYAENWGVPTVALRYFTVFGPRQRPDMAIHRLVESALSGAPFPLFGVGDAVRDFTYVSDVVEANLAVTKASVPAGAITNVAGGTTTSIADLITAVERVVECPVNLDRRPVQAGDVSRTEADLSRVRRLLNWAPETSLEAGLERQVRWHRDKLPRSSASSHGS